MKEVILKPGKFELAVFGFLSLPILIFMVWQFSFIWFIPFLLPVKFVYFLLILFLVGALLIDFEQKTFIARYFLLLIALFTIVIICSYPTRDWLVEKTEKQGRDIGLLVEKYRILKGHYPKAYKKIFLEESIIVRLSELHFIL